MADTDETTRQILRCDYAGAVCRRSWISGNGAPAEKTRAAAALDGWAHVGGKDYCGEHRHTSGPESAPAGMREALEVIASELARELSAADRKRVRAMVQELISRLPPPPDKAEAAPDLGRREL